MKKHTHHGKSSEEIIDSERIILEAGIKEGDTVVDAGCGDGYFSLSAAHAVGDEGEVYAIDIHHESIQKLLDCDDCPKNIRAMTVDFTGTTPVPPEGADHIVMIHVFHGFNANGEVEDALAEINRILTDEGNLTIVEFRKDAEYGPSLDVKLSGSELCAILSDFGFEKEKQFEAGPHSYGIVFRRL